jgi:(hydroxyamino)benzene mutase
MKMLFSAQQRLFILAGAILFLIGLLQGAAVQSFTNPRMALSAHLTAVQAGMAVMIVGLVWSSVILSKRITQVTQWAIIFGTYGLWLGLTFSAATGASKNLPIAGAGHNASPITEALVSAFVLGGSGLLIIGWVLFVTGLLRSKAEKM